MKLSGYVVDSWCGGGNARPEAKECILACNKKGAKLIFHTADGKSYKLKDQREALAHVGTRWQIEATLHGDGLLVVAKWTEAKPVEQAQAGSDG